MLDPLPPLAPEWAPYEEPFHEIARIVGVAPGFVLIPVAVPGPDLARALGQWLSEAGHPLVVHELIGDSAWEMLAGFLLSSSPPPDGVVMVIGPSVPPQGVSGPLGLVNQARDAIVKSLRRPLLWCGPRSFLNLTWENAPDFWSIRSVDHSLSPPVTRGATAPAAAQKSAAIVGPSLDEPTRSWALSAPPLSPPLSPQEILIAEAIVQGSLVPAAILAAREVEAALDYGRADDARRLADQHLAAGDAVPVEMRQRLAVLRARALGMLGRTGEAIPALDALLATKGLSLEVELDAVLERAELTVSMGDADAAEEWFARGLFLARQAGSAEGGIRARIGLGEMARLHGEPEEARRILSAAAADAEKLQDERVIQAARAAVARAFDQAHDASTARRVAGESRLDQDLLNQVYEAAIRAGLAERREQLLWSISPALVASLPYGPGPASQLRSDLSELNRVEQRRGGERPLEIWLSNAAWLAAPRPEEAAVFERALAALGAPPPAPPDARARAARQPAQIAGANDGSLGSTPNAADSPLCVLLYSRQDLAYSKDLQRHIAPLLRSGLARWWSPSQIAPGERVSHAIEERVREADVLVVLVSPELLASKEMRWVKEASQMGKRVVPVLLKPTAWHGTFLGRLSALPRNGKPISVWREEDEAWEDVVRGLRLMLQDMKAGASEKP